MIFLFQAVFLVGLRTRERIQPLLSYFYLFFWDQKNQKSLRAATSRPQETIYNLEFSLPCNALSVLAYFRLPAAGCNKACPPVSFHPGHDGITCLRTLKRVCVAALLLPRRHPVAACVRASRGRL